MLKENFGKVKKYLEFNLPRSCEFKINKQSAPTPANQRFVNTRIAKLE
jgi:hypothetical protein